MKKLLTVLLALAIVFTYSIPAVFADASTFNANVNLAQANITATLETNYSNMVKTIVAADTTAGVPASKEAWTSAAQLVKDAQILAITKRTDEIKANSKFENYTVAQLVDLYSEAKSTVASPTDFATDPVVVNQSQLYSNLYSGVATNNAAARAAFAETKASIIASINKVDLSVYSTTTPTTGDTYYTKAKAVVDQTLANVQAIVVASDADDATVATEMAKFGAFAKNVNGTEAAGSKLLATIAENYKDASTSLGTFKLSEAGSTDILTIAQEAASAMTLAAKKAAYVSQVNANAAQFLADNTSATGDLLTAVNAEKAAYVAGMTEIINATTTDAELTAIASTVANLAKPIATPTAVTTKYAVNAAKIAQLEAVAAKYKAYKDADGNLVKDAAKIDAVVAAAKVAAYKVATEWADADYNAAVAKITGTDCDAAKAVSSAVVAQKKAAIEAARKAALTDANGDDVYYAPEAAKVNALFDAQLAKVDAAKTDDEVKAVSATVIIPSTVLTKASLKTAIKAMPSFTANKGVITAYEAYLNTGSDKRDFTALDDDFFADLYATNGARTDAEVAALLDKAKAACDAVKTASQLTTEKKAVETQIAQLPTTITVENAAAVKAAYDAANAYCKDANMTMSSNDIANIATLKLDVKALCDAANVALKAKYAAIPVASKIAVTDKDAVKALAAEIKAFNDECDTYNTFAGTAADKLTTEATTLASDLVTIRGLEKAAVNSAINALPLNITIDNKAAVEAARKAYDAYVAEYTDYTTAAPVGYNQNAADDFTATYKALADAEAQLAAAETAQAKLVQAYKITASSKAYKGKMVIKWTVKGTAVTGVKYQIWRSTKKSSGYKYMFTTTAKTYKNTKNLKAGKTYYYKVRAYVTIDGVRYYSDWSNKAYRIAK